MAELYLNHVCGKRDHFGASVYLQVVWVPWVVSCKRQKLLRKGLLFCLCRIQTKLMKKPWHRLSEFPNPRRAAELTSHIPLHCFHCLEMADSSNGTLMIARCPCSGQELLSSGLQLQCWLRNWSCQPLPHPFIQDLFQTGGDTDLL